MEREFKGADVAAARAPCGRRTQGGPGDADGARPGGRRRRFRRDRHQACRSARDGCGPGRRRSRQAPCADRHGAEPRRALYHGHADGDGADAGGQESPRQGVARIAADLPLLLSAATEGVRTRGKANLGDKTLLDALQPASDAFAAALSEGKSLPAAADAMLAAARDGRDRVTPLRNRIGRASWLGERTEGKVDPGCAFAVIVLTALASAWAPERQRS